MTSVKHFSLFHWVSNMNINHRVRQIGQSYLGLANLMQVNGKQEWNRVHSPSPREANIRSMPENPR
ncbi:MAG: hypothetical protein BZY88_08370 [SAR202 cluster bacterium Io17-Chloro-G9]|nr:MAG: hypothetical protein BZY88_08370 [SAR202 cluster bacterium Io17-Chloro-G9]